MKKFSFGKLVGGRFGIYQKTSSCILICRQFLLKSQEKLYSRTPTDDCLSVLDNIKQLA